MIFLPKVEIKSNLRPVGVSPTERSKYLMVIREFFYFFLGTFYLKLCLSCLEKPDGEKPYMKT